MAEQQAADPVTPGNPPAAEATGQDGSLLTGKTQAAEGVTPPLAAGAASEPRQWKAQLPDDLKADVALDKFPAIGDLAKSYLELERKMGAAVTVPGPQATDEEKARYRKSIGVPDKPTDYKIVKAKLPEGLFEGTHERFLALAHNQGLTQTQAEAVSALVNKEILTTLTNGLKAVKTTAAEAEATLRGKHGAQFDTVISDADRAHTYFSDRAWELVRRSGLGNDPDIIEAFARIGATRREHTFVDGKPSPGNERKPLEQLMYGTKPQT